MGGKSSKAKNADEDDEEEEENNSKIVPPKLTLYKDLSSRVQLNFRCEDLNCNGKQSIVVVYTKKQSDKYWVELGQTELCPQETRWPVWGTCFEAEFKVEITRLIRCEVYRVRKPQLIADLMEQKFIGSCEFNVTDAMMARAQDGNNGWFKKRLENHRRQRGDPLVGKMCIFAEECIASKMQMIFNARATGIASQDMWKFLPDPYFTVNRCEAINAEGEIQLRPVFRSHVGRRSKDPKFGSAEITASQTCQCKTDEDLIIEVYDWYRTAEDKYIGEVVLTWDELVKGALRGMPMVVPIYKRDLSVPRYYGMTRLSAARVQARMASRSKSKGSKGGRVGSRISGGGSSRSSGSGSKDSGSGSGYKRTSSWTSSDSDGRKSTNLSSERSNTESVHTGDSGFEKGVLGPTMGNLILEDFNMVRLYSFLDYIRGGMELRLMIGIDFSRSNIGQNNPNSYHSLAYQEGEDTAYATCIRSLGDVIRAYDNDDMYPVYGFGAKIPPSHSVCSDCFALTGDFFSPEVEGIEGILKAYHRALQICHFHGPSRLAEVIQLSANLSKPYKQVPTGFRQEFPDQKFFVMLILTDGDIEDEEQVVREIRACSDLPVCFIFVGIGNGDFTFLKELANGMRHLTPVKEGGLPNQETRRNLVNFVAFNDYRDDPAALSANTLCELPREVVAYYASENIKPRGLEQMEDKEGNPTAMVIPKEPVTAAVTFIETKKSSSDRGSRSGSMLADGVSRTASGSPGPSRKGTNMSHMLSERGSTSEESSMLQLRQPSKDSQASQDTTAKDPLEEEIKEERLAILAKRVAQPETVYLIKAREDLVMQGTKLGYEKAIINRTIRDGIAAASLDAILDNMLNAGYGKGLTYKEAALQAIPDDEDEDTKLMAGFTLPGVPLQNSTMLPELAFMTPGMNGKNSDAGSRLGLIALSSAGRTKSALTSNRRGTRDTMLSAFGELGDSSPTGTKENTRRASFSPRSRMGKAGSRSPPARGSPTLTAKSSKEPWAEARIEDGSAARTLLELSASRSANASKEQLGLPREPIRTTSKTLEEVAGRLGKLSRRTKSKGDGQSRRNSGTFFTIQETDEPRDAVPEWMEEADGDDSGLLEVGGLLQEENKQRKADSPKKKKGLEYLSLEDSSPPPRKKGLEVLDDSSPLSLRSAGDASASDSSKAIANDQLPGVPATEGASSSSAQGSAGKP
eukprot:TRINITY_DN9121_c3_g1_i1.p1 TRINITY_DN9121_c3_g1~~TRINITY_DN9121_c3_g1_i1.p1  ORF type:complete len:1197 (-),score=220.01 TRINITY_DN9121_c3_g1_i1:217-3807(-)